jgi:hypothetical protein
MKRKTSPGRPPIADHKLTTARSSLTRDQLKTAAKLGHGNIAAGIRKALDIAGGKTP